MTLVVLLAASCSSSSSSDDVAVGDDSARVDEIVVFDDGERSIVLVDPAQTADGRRWVVQWSVDGELGSQPAIFTEPLANCAADTLSLTTDPFLAELRARGLNPGVGADGATRLAVIEAMLGCDGAPELRELALGSLPDFDDVCLTDLLVTDEAVLALYGLQNPDASVDERRPAAERFGPCLDLLMNAPDTLAASSTECVRAGEAELGTEMMLGTQDVAVRLIELFEACLTSEEFAEMDFG